MIAAGILDGDWVVVEQRDEGRAGEIVVPLIHDEGAILESIETPAYSTIP